MQLPLQISAAFFFATKILCDLSKATRHYSKLHVVITTKNEL